MVGREVETEPAVAVAVAVAMASDEVTEEGATSTMVVKIMTSIPTTFNRINMKTMPAS